MTDGDKSRPKAGSELGWDEVSNRWKNGRPPKMPSRSLILVSAPRFLGAG